MEIWLDTIDLKAIERAKKRGLLHGITTNPTILFEATSPAEDVLENLLTHFSGPIAVQTTAWTANEMVEQGKDLYDFSPRIIVKVAVTEEGLEAIHRLANADIPVMATAIYEPMQACLAAHAGATYTALYYSHLGENALPICRTILEMNLPAKLLVASLKTPEQVVQCAAADCDAVTLKASLFEECLKPPQQAIEQLHRFDQAWKKAPSSKLLPF